MELPQKLTPLTPEQVTRAIAAACQAAGLEPTPNLVAMLVGHSAGETGMWRKCVCNNLGNVKATDEWIAKGGDHVFYDGTEAPVGETLSVQGYRYALKTKAPAADGSGPNMWVESQTSTSVTCGFKGEHPQTRFRAFATLKEGAEQHLRKMTGRYVSAIDFAQRGDPEGYTNAIYSHSYFTAGVAGYRRGVRWRFEQLLPIVTKILREMNMSERPFVDALPDDIYERDEAILRGVVDGENDPIGWVDVAVNSRLTITVNRDLLSFDGVRLGVTPYTQQQIADHLEAVLLTPKMCDIVARAAMEQGGLVGMFPQPINTTTAGYVKHSAAIDAALPDKYCGIVDGPKHWCNSADVYTKRGYATNYGGTYPAIIAPSGTIASVSDPDLRVIQGPYEAHGTGSDVDGDGYADSGHLDYSQMMRFCRHAAKYDGAWIDIRTILTGSVDNLPEYPGSYNISHEGALPASRLPGVPLFEDDPYYELEELAIPRITRPGEQGANVVAWQKYLLGDGHDLPRFGADGDHGDETEKATQSWFVVNGLEKVEPVPPTVEPALVPLSELAESSYVQARHFGKGRPRGTPNTVTIHVSQTGERSDGAEILQGTAARSAREASWHAAVDSDSVAYSANIDDHAYAAGPGNDTSVHIEIVGRVSQGAAGWADDFSAAALEIAAGVTAEYLHMMGQPAARVDSIGLLAGKPGVCGHSDWSAASREARRRGLKVDPWWNPTKQRWRSTNHGDPGPTFPWPKFMGRVRAHLALLDETSA